MQLNNLLSDERGVSPVIGVILMVAITVILAAVIGTMVLGLTDGVGQNVQAGANINDDSANDRITISYNSNQNAEYLNVSVTNTTSAIDEGQSATYKLGSPGAKLILDGSGNATSGEVSHMAGNYFDGTSTLDDGTTTDWTVTGGNTYAVTVTAVKGDTTTVVAEDTIEL